VEPAPRDPQPVFTVREHPKARTVRIKASARHGVVVTVPTGMSRTTLLDILQRNGRLIEEMTLRVKQLRADIEHRRNHILPERISLLAIDESWSVSYEPILNDTALPVERPDFRLIISSVPERRSECLAALRAWLRARASERLPAWITRYAAARGFSIRNIRVSLLRSRWGSCSSHRTISLNALLLLFPPDLVEYVFLHELCHLTHLNHSPRYWNLVAHHDPDFDAKRRRIARLSRELPPWTDPGLIQ
jgi:predicted metal-dependent hydrolase